MKKSRLVLLGVPAGAAALALSATLSSPASAVARHGGAVAVTMRVEGMRSTLLAETLVHVRAQRVDPDGKPADSCDGLTAAAALQQATHGRWSAGKYSSGLGYPVVGVLGESHAFSSDYYWSLWIDGKPATTGICEATLHAGERVLLFPQCSQEAAANCPQGLFNPPVLELSGPRRAHAGQSVKVRVRALANATGAASAAAGVKLTGGVSGARTNAAGEARVRLGRGGHVRLVATAPGDVRDELTIALAGH